MNILIVKLNAIGDVLFATPLLEACRIVYPDAAVDWLVASHAEPILRNQPSLRDAIVYQGPWGGTGLASLLAYRRLMIELRSRQYDAVFCLHRNFAAQLLVYATEAPLRIGFRGGLSGVCFTHSAEFEAQAHETERYLNLLRALDHQVSNPGMHLGLTLEAQVTAELMLVDHQPRRPLLGLAPGGGRNPGTEMLIKRWPAELYGEAARRLIAETGGGVIVMGSPDERALCGEVTRLAGDGAVNFCGQTDLPQLAGLLDRCQVMIANDSGPLHIAAALGVPTVALFGPTDPRLVAPLGPQHRFLWRPPECGPCYRPDNARERTVWGCDRLGDELRCLRDITVDDVVEAVTDALGRKTWPDHISYRGPSRRPLPVA